MDVRERIRDYFDTVIPEPVGDEDDIFELALVDSLFALQIVAFVEGDSRSP